MRLNPSTRLSVALGCMLMASTGQAVYSDPATAPEETCRTLAEVAYRAASAPLSKADARHLRQLRRDAGRANQLRPAIDPERVEHARVEGGKSHGNHGLGNWQLAAARDDGFEAALDVYQECMTEKRSP